jgi:hypothetical protein
MVVLMLIERAAPHVWHRLGFGGRQQAPPQPAAGAEAPQQPRPASPTLAEFDPVSRAWEGAWSELWSRLTSEQKGLLFDLIHAAAKEQVPPPKTQGPARELLAQLSRYWEEHQARGFESLADLKDDDQARWVDVLRQINDRYTQDLRPAMESLIAGQRLTENQQAAWRGLEKSLVAVAAAQIEDDTVFRPAEKEIWLHWLRRVRDAAPAELRREAIPATYLQLAEQPGIYRGQVVTVEGTAKLAYRTAASANHLGIEEYVVYWIHPRGGPDSPIVVYALGVPAGFPLITARDLGADAAPLREEMTVTGVFVKRWAYAGQGGTYSAPLLLAHVPQWYPAAMKGAAAASAPSGPAQAAAIAAAALLLALVTTITLWKLSGRRRSRTDVETAPRVLAALADLQAGPSPHEALRALEKAHDADGT